jgi:hypothetical protein
MLHYVPPELQPEIRQWMQANGIGN